MSEWDIPQHKSALDHAPDTANLITAMQDVGVQRFVYVSRLGADSASGFPVFRIRGETEALIRDSGIAATILRPAVSYGPGDGFISILAMLAKTIPLVLPLLDTGLSRFQPLWIDDLGRCIAATLERDDLIGKTVAIGGPEHMTLEQMAMEVLQALGIRRILLRTRFPVIRLGSQIFDLFLLRNPCPLWLLDILTRGSATDLGSVSQTFGFEPARFAQSLDFLRTHRSWRRDLLRFVLRVR